MNDLEEKDVARNVPSQSAINMTIIGLVGQVGCLTLVILAVAVALGMWLDTQFGTRPWITIGMLFVSIPISLVIMFFVAKAASRKFKKEYETRLSLKEEAIGKD